MGSNPTVDYLLGGVVVLTAVFGCSLGIGMAPPILEGALGLTTLVAIIVLVEDSSWRLEALVGSVLMAMVSGGAAWVFGFGIDRLF